ncbi:hypothetical protein [Nitrosomonas marina]|uniref:Ig-like domain-containing protein n=1 Tax=Nitrosomonas marina TaxID=917 RepID=A0A1H8FA64_9PROT|nr:hypothetical protein [Nitrosomonas marina]SEN28107.1 hypothetical protein SAMN05216325_11251 [Nitrosomonas marina]
MELTKNTSIACTLSLLFYANAWAVSDGAIDSRWHRTGIATSQSTMNTSNDRVLKKTTIRPDTQLSCTVSNQEKVNTRNQPTSYNNQLVLQQVC